MFIEIVVGILVAWLIADFLSGFWHWIEDRYFDERWPIIGHYIAKPNTLHHAQPTAFLKQSYLSRNWTTILPAATALALRSHWAPRGGSTWRSSSSARPTRFMHGLTFACSPDGFEACRNSDCCSRRVITRCIIATRTRETIA